MKNKINRYDFMLKVIQNGGFENITKNSNYECATKKVFFNCSEHGYFHKSLRTFKPESRCQKCGFSRTSMKLVGNNPVRSKRVLRDAFLKKVVDSGGFNNITRNTKYKSNKEKIEFNCVKHGLFFQRPDHFYNGHHCQKCGIEKNGKSLRSNTKHFLKKSKEKHGDFYDYSLSVYTLKDSKIKIICPMHGIFEQTATAHMRGSGCYDCNHVGPYKDRYISNSIKRHNGLSNLYIIKCFKGDEVFYKVGITCYSIEKRYKKCKDMPYQYSVILFESMGVEDALYFERSIHRMMTRFKHKPNIKFGGSARECFTKVYFRGKTYE